jgi:hypothetical protein
LTFFMGAVLTEAFVVEVWVELSCQKRTLADQMG